MFGGLFGKSSKKECGQEAKSKRWGDTNAKKKDKKDKDKTKSQVAAAVKLAENKTNEEPCSPSKQKDEGQQERSHNADDDQLQAGKPDELQKRLEDDEKQAATYKADDHAAILEKRELKTEVEALRNEIQVLKKGQESAVAEKWELSAANADLQNRLQTMTITCMQGRPEDGMLQEELRKMQVSLSEERKVTEKLSRSLELEKRRSESLEQKAKGSHRKSGNGSGSGSAILTSLIPEEMRNRQELLAGSMEKHRNQCETLTRSLEDCQEKLEGFEIQEDYHVADLRKEVAKIRKLLHDERRRSVTDSQKLDDFQNSFVQVLKDYDELIEGLKTLTQIQRKKAQGQDDSSQLESLNSRLAQAQADMSNEKTRAMQLEKKIQQYETQVEEIPVLKAQVEVYQADFNAERRAREQIAGEKADLEEELRKLKIQLNRSEDGRSAKVPESNRAPPPALPNSAVRETITRHFSADQERLVDKEGEVRKEAQKTFSCPKCTKEFKVLSILQTHVNACLDRQ